MNPMEVIQASYNEFTKKEKLIADYIMENPLIVMQSTTDMIASNANSSKAAFIRMCQKMGYNGFSDFKYSFSRYLNSNVSSNPEISLVQSITEQYCKQISTISQTLTLEQIEKLTEMIKNARHVKTFGFNRTGLSAKQFRLRLSKIGVDCEDVYDHVLFSELINSSNEEDVFIVFTIKANNPIYNICLSDFQKLNENHCKLVIVTMTPKSPLCKNADLLITLPNISRTNANSYLDDQAIFFIFIEIIINALSSNL